MFSAFSLALLFAIGSHDLRVCADPNNLPFSNRRGEGFENRIAGIIARDLGKTVKYTWFPQRRGFVRNTLKANKCDLIVGVPTGFDLAHTTRAYYRSTYVFVTRRDRHLHIASFDDPALKRLRIGVHVIGDDYSNPPPASALAKRHIINNVVGYTIYGDYSQPDPPRRLIDAVAKGEIDVAIAWGPLAGYFAKQEPVALDIAPVSPQIDLPFIPFVFDIAMATRRGDDALYTAVENALDHRSSEIHAVLQQYGVPLVEEANP